MTDTIKVRVLIERQEQNERGTYWEITSETILGYLSYGEYQLNPYNESEITYGFHLVEPLHGTTIAPPLFEPKITKVANRAMIFEGWNVISFTVPDPSDPNVKHGVKAGEQHCRWTIFPMEASGLNLN